MNEDKSEDRETEDCEDRELEKAYQNVHVNVRCQIVFFLLINIYSILTIILLSISQSLSCTSSINVVYFGYPIFYLQGDDNEDDNKNSQIGDSVVLHQNNDIRTQIKGKARKYLFNMVLVNSYGSTDIQVLEDDGEPPKLTGDNDLFYGSVKYIQSVVQD